MSSGIDIQFVRENYAKMPDAELVRVATQDAAGLTPEAQQVVAEEIRKRGLDANIVKGVQAQNRQYTLAEIDAYCALVQDLDCPVCGASGVRLNGTMTSEVVSFLVMTQWTKKLKIACPDCLDKASVGALTKTSLLGWWGIPWGLIRTPIAIVHNIKSKKLHRMEGPNGYLRTFVLGKIGEVETYKDNPKRLQQIIAMVLLLIVSAISADKAVAQDTTWMDRSWKETSAGNASYYRIKTKSGTHWQISDHFLNGKVQMKGNYADDSMHVQQGEFVWYDSTESPREKAVFSKNKRNGPSFVYHPGGKIQMKANYKDDELDGVCTGYYRSGRIAGTATYKNGKQLSASFYNEDGSENKKITEFYADADFPGGPPQWLRYLNKTLRYPESAIKQNQEGTVILGFSVSAEGKLSHLTVYKSVSPVLDEEAMRVVSLTRDWKPAVIGGVYSESYKLQPIVFSLKGQ